MKLPTIPRDANPNMREIARASNIFKRIREPIPAKLRKKILERAKNTCEYSGCNIKNEDIKLHNHHKNLKNDDNRPSNLSVLCPNHHQKIHTEASKKRKEKKLKEKEEPSWKQFG